MRFFSFVASKRGKWLVLALWIVIFAVGGVFGNKLQGATKNEESSFLPTNAESTKELDLEKTFPGGNIAPALIVYQRSSGLTRSDIAKINRDVRAAQAVQASTN